MAKTNILTDDLDGSRDDVVTVKVLTSDGSAYKVDLGPDSRASLDEALAPFTSKGRKAGAGAEENAAIRAWAAENGHTVSETGRISAEVRKAYKDAHAES